METHIFVISAGSLNSENGVSQPQVPLLIGWFDWM
jgi:hypothetical protein